MSTPPTLRQLAATTAVALALSHQAGAAGLTDDAVAQGKLLGQFSIALSEVAGKEANPNLRARGFAQALQDALDAPSEKTRVVDYPKPVSANMLRVLAVVPPKGFEQLPIPVCAEQDNKVLGTWDIKPTGDVTRRPWDGAKVSESPTSSACRAFIFAARDEINQKLASGQPPR